MIHTPAHTIFEWDDSLILGIPEIDREHKIWIDLVSEFCQAVTDGRASEVIYKALVEAIAYTETHLSHEEQFMDEHGYAYLEDHKQQHNLASEEMHKFTTGHFSEDYLIKYFSDFLPNWLFYHINTSDRKMAEWVLAKRNGLPTPEMTPRWGFAEEG